jgi:hypothetical protein
VLGLKRGVFGSAKTLMGSGSATNDSFDIFFNGTTNGIMIELYANAGAVGANLRTSSEFRDTNAWYHIVVAVDTTQATASNRYKIYVNGVQQTSFNISSYPTQNFDIPINQTNDLIRIGTGQQYNAYHFDGSMSHVHFIDGTAYDASAFGQTDATTGIWKPKLSPSVTYGTNGFFLKFENSGSMGLDSSGNGNNLTVNGTLTQTVDTPTNVFCTVNALNIASDGSGSANLSNGNLTITSSGSSQNVGTLAPALSSGSKWYYEFKAVSGVTSSKYTTIGWMTDISAFNAGAWGTSGTFFLYATDGDIYNNGWQGAGTASTWTNGDIIGCSVDLNSNEKLRQRILWHNCCIISNIR